MPARRPLPSRRHPLASPRGHLRAAQRLAVGDGGRSASALGTDEENGGMTVLGGRPVRPHIER
jgi:hypothetical protein